MKKRWLSLALVLCMVLTLLPVSAFAADIVASGECGAQGNNVTWTLDGSGLLTISGNGEMANYMSWVTAPWFQDRNLIRSVKIGEGVTSIGSCAFDSCINLKSFIIPDHITSIGSNAFYGCTGLISISIPDGITSIQDGTFGACSSLSSITIPDGVTSIGREAFRGCTNLKNIMLPESVSSIDYHAFYTSGLKNIIIPNGVPQIVMGVFCDCPGLESITIPDSVTRIDFWAFNNCNSLTDIYYSGTQQQWNNVSIAGNNEPLGKAAIHCNYSGSITFDENRYSAKPGDTFAINAVYVSNEEPQHISWFCNDASAISFSGTSVVGPSATGQPDTYWLSVQATVHKDGNYQIGLTASGASASAQVQVVDAWTIVVRSVEIMDADKPYVLKVNGSGMLHANVNKSDYDVDGVWTTSDPSIAVLGDAHTTSESSFFISYEGNDHSSTASVKIYGLQPGEATISLRMTNGHTVSRKVVVLSDSSAQNQSYIESNSYGVPVEVPPLSEQQQKNIERCLSDFQNAFNKYSENVQKELNQKAKSGGQDFSDSFREQAKQMMAMDAAHQYLTCADAPDAAVEDAYTALCMVLYSKCEDEYTKKHPGVDFSNIDFARASFGTDIVKAVASAIDHQSIRHYNDPDFSYNINGNIGNYFGARFGDITVTSKTYPLTSYTFVVCSEANVTEMVKEYLNQLKILSSKAVVNVYAQMANDLSTLLTGKSLSDGISEKVEQWAAKKINQLDTVGLSRIYEIVNNSERLYGIGKKLIQGDATDRLNAVQALNNFSYEYASASVAKRFAKSLDTAKKKLAEAMIAFYDPDSIEQEKGFFERIFSFNCPIAIKVYDADGKEIGCASDEEFWFDDSIEIVEIGEGKKVCSSNQEICVEVTGTDTGVMNCSFEQLENGVATGRVNYYNVPVSTGSSYTADVSADPIQGTEQVQLANASEEVLDADEYIPAEADARVTVFAEPNDIEAGMVLGSGLFARGDTVLLHAIPEGSYVFMGWYNEDNELISVSETYSFTAKSDCSLTAVFAEPFAVALEILEQPASLSAEPDQMVSFAVEASGEELSYRWQYCMPGENEWHDLNTESAQTAALEVLASAGLNGQSYRCQITDAYGNVMVSDAATLTVKAAQPSNPFTDVPDGKFYTDAVLWAVSHDPQITTGVTDTTFMPDRVCTRAHVVTFLWRANGCPEPKATTNTFKDVPNGKYYTKAVLWASEQGITTGYDDGTFRPDTECTRAQVVTFLWRANGSPNPERMDNPFRDVSSSAYYAKAILWAFENGITDGRTPTTFDPDAACTRAHVVTFLYRDMA